MAKTTRRRLTDDERAQRRAQDRERLEQSARELLSSDGWRRWIEVRARNGLLYAVVGGCGLRAPLSSGPTCRANGCGRAKAGEACDAEGGAASAGPPCGGAHRNPDHRRSPSSRRCAPCIAAPRTAER